MTKLTDAEKTVAQTAKALEKRIGWSAWGMLGPELRQKLVRAEVLAIIGQIASFEDSHAGNLATAGLQWGDETGEEVR
jgi:hypothetical protein